MGKHFDEELRNLHENILKMGIMAQEAIFKSIEALKGRDKFKGDYLVISGSSC